MRRRHLIDPTGEQRTTVLTLCGLRLWKRAEADLVAPSPGRTTCRSCLRIGGYSVASPPPPPPPAPPAPLRLIRGTG